MAMAVTQDRGTCEPCWNPPSLQGGYSLLPVLKFLFSHPKSFSIYCGSRDTSYLLQHIYELKSNINGTALWEEVARWREGLLPAHIFGLLGLGSSSTPLFPIARGIWGMVLTAFTNWAHIQVLCVVLKQRMQVWLFMMQILRAHSIFNYLLPSFIVLFLNLFSPCVIQ